MKHTDSSEDCTKAFGRYRGEIDNINVQIIALLARRQEIASSIGQIKRRLGMEMFDPSREQEILKCLSSQSSEHLTQEAIRYVFNEIMSAARSVQEPLTVAFLGPETSFSEQAAISLFGHSASFHPAETIEDVFTSVEKGICKQGVVPVENSLEGSVTGTLDLFHKHDVKIRAEVYLRIRHHVLSKAENLSEIKYLYSHPMAIAQCRSWIKDHLPGVTVREVESTSRAASLAATDPRAAAVGSHVSALRYELTELAKDIQDQPDNVTRFLAIGTHDAAPSGKDKTSVLFFLSHKPGALCRALEPLGRRNINIRRIESRPIKVRKWEYLFFVDLEGHERNSNLRDAVREMEERCMSLRRLGSYPAGNDPWD